MNLTIGSTKVNTRSNKTRFVVAAAGLALTVSAMGALTLWSGSTSKPSTVRPAQITAQRSAPDEREMVYYLVGSQQEAAALSSAISSELGFWGNGSFEYQALVVSTPEDEFLAAEMTRELMQFAPQVRVVDTRSN